MRLRSATITVIVLVAIAIGVDHAVAAQGASLPPEMTGVEWTLVSLQDAPGNVQDTTGKGMTIRFDPSGTVNGSGGCNTFRGGYTAGDGQKLTFEPLATTLMACEQEIMDREAAYLKALEGVSTYALDGASHLQLTFNNGQGMLSYTKSQPTALPQLDLQPACRRREQVIAEREQQPDHQEYRRAHDREQQGQRAERDRQTRGQPADRLGRAAQFEQPERIDCGDRLPQDIDVERLDLCERATNGSQELYGQPCQADRRTQRHQPAQHEAHPQRRADSDPADRIAHLFSHSGVVSCQLSVVSRGEVTSPLLTTDNERSTTRDIYLNGIGIRAPSAAGDRRCSAGPVL
jgi:heat shock protein HslJ